MLTVRERETYTRNDSFVCVYIQPHSTLQKDKNVKQQHNIHCNFTNVRKKEERKSENKARERGRQSEICENVRTARERNRDSRLEHDEWRSRMLEKEKLDDRARRAP